MLEETRKCVRLIIDHNFSWGNHITHVSKRIFSRIYMELRDYLILKVYEPNNNDF